MDFVQGAKVSRANDGAFPVVWPTGGNVGGNEGLTIREHFAALAMQGLLTDNNYAGSKWTSIASDAISAADALIAALAKETK